MKEEYSKIGNEGEKDYIFVNWKQGNKETKEE
jgi:hypothetical protein